jgi:Pentose-5-phosphate-3-epimerase
MRAIKIAPSIVSADLARLAQQVRECEEAGAEYIHIDVMDGRFVPAITIGWPVVEAIRRSTGLVLDEIGRASCRERV